MKITLAARMRAFLAKHGPATIDEVVAALGKHVTASQAIRNYDRNVAHMRRSHGYKTPKKVSQRRRIEVGTRIQLTTCLQSARDVRRKSPCTYTLAS